MIYVALEKLTEQERKSMPKLIGIDLEWYVDRWNEYPTAIRLTDFIERELKLGRN